VLKAQRTVVSDNSEHIEAPAGADDRLDHVQVGKAQ